MIRLFNQSIGRLRLTKTKSSISGLAAAAAVISMLALAVAPARADERSFVFSSIDVPGATRTTAVGINPEGNIVGGYTIDKMSHSYLLSKQGTLTIIDPPYGISGTSNAQGINPEGDVVGLYTDHGTIVGGDAFRTRAYLRDESGNFTPIDFPGAENTLAIKITPTGQVVGCYHQQDKDFAVSGGGTMHGYVYQNGSYQSLPVPATMHNGITRDGRIIVGVVWPTPTEFHAYKVEDGVYALLDLPGYVVKSDARDINPSGEIVGFFVDLSNKTHGFLLNRDGFTAIDFPGASATQVRGINAGGDVTGLYVHASVTHGFVGSRTHGHNH